MPEAVDTWSHDRIDADGGRSVAEPADRVHAAVGA
jgi:hypothetical protein